jgi:hypothetical protein
VKLHTARVHKTRSGRAEASDEDPSMARFTLKDVKISDGIEKEWKDKSWWDQIRD